MRKKIILTMSALYLTIILFFTILGGNIYDSRLPHVSSCYGQYQHVQDLGRVLTIPLECISNEHVFILQKTDDTHYIVSRIKPELGPNTGGNICVLSEINSSMLIVQTSDQVLETGDIVVLSSFPKGSVPASTN